MKRKALPPSPGKLYIAAMKIMILIGALCAATPALADDGPCFELGGQGIAPCATPKGSVAVESNLFDWSREGDGIDRTDTLTFASTIARIGIGGNTELRLGGTPFLLTKASGDRWRSSVGDLTVGAKHQFGSNGPVGFALQVTLPTGTDPAGQQTWSADAIVPMQFPLNKVFTLDLTGTVSAAANASGSGRHFALSLVAGSDIALSEACTITADIKRLRDEDPLGATTHTSASLSLGVQMGKRAELTVGAVTGLDGDTQMEGFAGFGYRF